MNWWLVLAGIAVVLLVIAPARSALVVGALVVVLAVALAGVAGVSAGLLEQWADMVADLVRDVVARWAGAEPGVLAPELFGAGVVR